MAVSNFALLAKSFVPTLKMTVIIGWLVGLDCLQWCSWTSRGMNFVNFCLLESLMCRSRTASK